jgi:transposase
MRSVAEIGTIENKEKEIEEATIERNLYVGVDMHGKSWSIAVGDEYGTIITRTTMAPRSEALIGYLSRYSSCDLQVCYEAGGFGYWLYDDLTDAGIAASVIAPSKVYKKPGEKVKTDRRDSLHLALQLSKGFLTGITVPDKTRRAHRQMMRLYDQVKKDKQRVMIRIKAFLRVYGVEKPVEVSKSWSQSFVRWLKTFEFAGDVDGCLSQARDEYVLEYEHLCERERVVKTKLSDLGKLPAYRARMEAVCARKGVGETTALRLLLEIGKCSRFKNSRKFASFLGLTPRESSSGEKVRRGSITGCGNFALRSSLVEIAWGVIRYDESLRHTFIMLLRRRGKMRAIVAIARKLAVRIYWELREVELLEEAE